MSRETFSFETIAEFDRHISDSITGYDVLHSLIVNISSFFIKKDTTVIDLGCTSGKLLKEIRLRYSCPVIGYDITDAQFYHNLDLRKQDITDPDFQIPATNLIYSVFTLQFLPYQKRLMVLKKVYDALEPNGTLIICEKEVCGDGQIQEVFTFSNYQNKRKSFSPEQILDKETDLRFIMKCLHAKDNLSLFRQAGFRVIEPFFQSLNFKGYICRK